MKNMGFLISLMAFAALSLTISCGDDVEKGNSSGSGYSQQQDISADDESDYGFLLIDSSDESEYAGTTHAASPSSSDKRIRYRISWSPNREKGVNSRGGGYIIYVSDKKNCPPEKAVKQRVPYVSGSHAPTEALLSLAPGTWHVKIAGYSAFNGGTAGPSSDEIIIQAEEEEK